jgi:probable phosphoglycerate mutase
LYLVRHGETDWNAEGRLLSSTDEPLNAMGEQQAQALSADMAPIAWDRAYSSPLSRAHRTADILLSARRDAPALTLDARLVEMDFGPYEGWSDEELAADPVAVRRRRDGVEIAGIEPEASVEARARSFFADLSDLSGTTLVVGHGRMLRILLSTVVLGMPASLSHYMRMRNCRPAIVEPGAKPLLLGFNVGRPADEAHVAEQVD